MQIIQFLVIFLLFIGSNAFNNYANIKCGKRKDTRTSKIVGGADAEKFEFPWIVSLTRRGGHFCGGSLINSRFVLTAGHCLCSGIDTNVLKPENIKITLGQHDLTTLSSETFEKSVKSITVHPNYTCNKPQNDIAILELVEDLEWSTSVAPVCIPIETNKIGYVNIDNTVATVAGWGWTNENNALGGRTKILQKAEVNVIESSKCQQWYKSQGKKTNIKDTQICAGYENGQIDACWADSGGPLMIKTGDADQMMMVGIVSTGIGCARPFLPGLYTRVSMYIQWIDEVVKP